MNGLNLAGNKRRRGLKFWKFEQMDENADAANIP